MTPADRYSEGERAKIAMEVLDDAFSTVSASYMERLIAVASSEPWAADKLRALAQAQRVADEVRQHITALVGGMSIAEAEMAHTRKIQAMSPERRKVLGITL